MTTEGNVQGRERATAQAGEEAPRPTAITLILTAEDGRSVHRSRAITAKPFYEADATPQEQPIEEGDGTVTVTMWPLRR